MTRKMTTRVVAIVGAGAIATSVAFAAPAAANSGKTTLAAGNGTVGVNQVLTATWVWDNADTSCDDEQGAVSFDFQVSNGTDLGTIAGTCTPVSNGSFTPVATWTATMNWTPTTSGNLTVTTYASQQWPGGVNTVGQSSKKVKIAPSQQTSAPSKVQNLKVTGVSTNAVSLNWNAPSSTGGSPISGYIVKWSGPTSGQVTVQGNTTNANIGTLSAGSAYTFSVAAANSQGWSDWVSVTQNTANAPTPPPTQQQSLSGPSWTGGGPKVKSGKWKTFNDTANLDTNAGHEARLSAVNKSASVKSVSFRYQGDFVQVRAVLKPGKKSGTFTLREYAPAVPGFTAMSVTRDIKVVK